MFVLSRIIEVSILAVDATITTHPSDSFPAERAAVDEAICLTSTTSLGSKKTYTGDCGLELRFILYVCSAFCIGRMFRVLSMKALCTFGYETFPTYRSIDGP